VAQADTPIGVAGAVNPKTDSTPPGQQTRTVMVGAQMLMNEKVVTGPQGSTQLVFNDHSTLTIGPSSEVVIDQFVYDPATNSGKMAVSLGKGVMRFVGGELSHKGNASITTPTATVGIRGGIVMLRVSSSETAVINLFGNSEITATNCDAKAQRCKVSILRPGFGTTVSSSNAEPASPFLVPSDQIATLTVQLQSSPSQNGGSTNPPTDANTRANGTGQSNSGLVAHNTAPQAPQGGGTTPPDANNKDLNAGPGSLTNPTSVGDITRQQQIAGAAEPTNFPDGFTTIGDLRTVAAPRVFTYSQNNVAILYTNGGPATQVGSYNFDMTINLGAPANRSLAVNFTNVNVNGAAWPYAHVTNFAIGTTLPAPDFQFGPFGPANPGLQGINISTSCASGVACAFGYNLTNAGGRVAAFANHNAVLYSDAVMPIPSPGAPGTAAGSGTTPRVTH